MRILLLCAALAAGFCSSLSSQSPAPGPRGEEWLQFQFDSERSGNAEGRRLDLPLGLAGALPLSDAVFTSPVAAEGRLFVVDGSASAYGFDAGTLKLLWKRVSPYGPADCNNTSSPLVSRGFLHFGTMAGSFWVLRARDGSVVREIRCGEPILSSPVEGKDGRVYFATAGARIYALDPAGRIQWTWDFVREVLHFRGNRWSGEEWAARGKRVGWKDQFCCSRNLLLHGKTLVIPAGGSVVWLEDLGEAPRLLGVYAPRESPSTLGISMDAEGRVYRQWYRRDNTGSLEVLTLRGRKLRRLEVKGTRTSYKSRHGMGFSGPAVRGEWIYRCRPEQGFGLCRYGPKGAEEPLAPDMALAPPVLAGDRLLYGDLFGRLHVLPLSGKGKPWSFSTPFGKALSAPPIVFDGKVAFGCEDGYLYVLAPGGKAEPPRKELGLERIRSPLGGGKAGAEWDWFTHYGDYANTNCRDQGLEPPFKLKWIRRFSGTVKQLSVCGGGRMYTHTAEGIVSALEEETGRLLWRRAFPGVHASYTTPLYREGRLYLPQAGLKGDRLRCLDAATGKTVWEVPFTGSPSWNRQQPPIVYGGLVFYLFSSGRYTPDRWLFEHQSTFGFPKDQKPILRAWHAGDGKPAWSLDFSKYGAGGDDAGMCLMGGVLYYSCYFGRGPNPGVTAAVEPGTGKVLWVNTKQALHAGCALSGAEGRLYLGGYNPVEKDGKTGRWINRIWCLDAKTGALVWKSDPVYTATQVVTVLGDRLFTHAQYRDSYFLDRATGKILFTTNYGYRCTRFTASPPFLLGANMDVYRLGEKGLTLVSTGPALDVLLCVGAFASNGRIFFTTNGGGLQCSLVAGEEAKRPAAPWERPAGR